MFSDASCALWMCGFPSLGVYTFTLLIDNLCVCYIIYVGLVPLVSCTDDYGTKVVVVHVVGCKRFS